MSVLEASLKLLEEDSGLYDRPGELHVTDLLTHGVVEIANRRLGAAGKPFPPYLKGRGNKMEELVLASVPEKYWQPRIGFDLGEGWELRGTPDYLLPIDGGLEVGEVKSQLNAFDEPRLEDGLVQAYSYAGLLLKGAGVIVGEAGEYEGLKPLRVNVIMAGFWEPDEQAEDVDEAVCSALADHLIDKAHMVIACLEAEDASMGVEYDAENPPRTADTQPGVAWIDDDEFRTRLEEWRGIRDQIRELEAQEKALRKDGLAFMELLGEKVAEAEAGKLYYQQGRVTKKLDEEAMVADGIEVSKYLTEKQGDPFVVFRPRKEKP